MSNYPDDRKYSAKHEWLKIEGGEGVIGISYHAQKEMGDVVFVELPELGAEKKAGEALLDIESVKAAEQVYCPVGGKVTAVNETLNDHPEKVNKDPYGDGWMVRLKLDDPSEAEKMLDSASYLKTLEG